MAVRDQALQGLQGMNDCAANPRQRRLAAGLAYLCLGMMLAGCGLGGPIVVTATPLIVTATAGAQNDAPLPTPTPVIGGALPTVDLFATATPPNEIATALSGIPTGTPTGVYLPPSLTPTFTPTFTDSPVPTGIPGQAQTCLAQATAGFATILTRDPSLAQALGCPVTNAIPINNATQDFEQGRMVWASQYADQPIEVIYALYNNGTYQRYVDDWVEGIDPMAGADNPPAGKLAPIRGFGKVWRINPPVQQGLGWATTNENGTSGQIQRFERGEMIFVAALNQTFIFIGGTTWRLDGTPF